VDDALVGVKSTARLFGEHTAPFLAACYAGAVLLLALAGWLAGLASWFYPALALPAVLLSRQVVTLDINDPALCLRLFRANREAGLAIALAIVVGWI
jgi:4-hydroxybenzoate polyprenyltransferase